MRKILFLVAGALFSGLFPMKAQSLQGFVRVDSVRVYENSNQLLFPWSGGINFAQFSEIDLNLDGIKDLFVFDRSGNRITTYLNLGTANQTDYVLAPQYVHCFPRLHDWAILRDYNCDGKADIFTYTIAGFGIYKNTTTIAGGVSFQLMTTMVNTDRSPNSTHFIGNLYVSPVDIPAIRDMDGDGDMDVLTYENGGGRIEYHKNMSMELYGVCDSIKYIVASNCWGELTESALNASIALGTTCSPPPILEHHIDPQYSPLLLHSGSCLECINTDNDNDQDVIIGDIGSSHMAYVRNGGTNVYAVGDSVDQLWPSYNTSMNMDIFNCGFHLDVDNDGVKDVIVTPQAQNASENHTSVWLYKNIGTNSNVQVSYVENNFLQKDMIDVGEGSHPVFFDYDNDGDSDLFIGNYGYYNSAAPYSSKIALYKNTGTSTQPVFTKITDDFANINLNHDTLAGLAPTFGDLDADGDMDMICGNNVGKLDYFRKDPGPADNFTLITSTYQSIDVGNYATPQLVDVDRDGKTDLLIGEQSGNVNYYRNTGTSAAPVFTLVTSTFGGCNVCEAGWFTGYSAPQLIDDSGNYVLLIGSMRGFIYRYDSIDGNLAGNFIKTDTLYIDSYEGGNTSVATADFNNDGLYDLVMGNYAGGLSMYYGDLDTTLTVNEEFAANGFSVYPDPANTMITLDLQKYPNGTMHYHIFDVTGKLIESDVITSSSAQLNVSDLPQGIYFITLTNGSGYTATSRFIISR
ncbi:MAG TPA: T9SS type A sorting domain-containing protein [Bacteroidia bacterium]|jgi:hypothetical protein|nr:T9SS type A sorting domain-containing protein [Bacteroidia bacterium]